MIDVLALQMSDEPTTDETQESLPTSTYSVICTIPEDPA
jgi:hypothetical protein